MAPMVGFTTLSNHKVISGQRIERPEGVVWAFRNAGEPTFMRKYNAPRGWVQRILDDAVAAGAEYIDYVNGLEGDFYRAKLADFFDSSKAKLGLERGEAQTFLPWTYWTRIPNYDYDRKSIKEVVGPVDAVEC